jgi:hypothetical protein
MLNIASIRGYFAAFLLVAIHISSVAAETYDPPPPGTKSLVRDISAARNADGTVTVSGIVLLPQKTKIWIERVSSRNKTLARAETFVGLSGAFSAGPFSDQGKLPKSGPQRVCVIAYFNGAWQPRDVLAVLGESGKNLPSTALRPDDPEFPTAGGHLEDERVIQFPAPSEESIVIEHVKNSKLYVQGEGQAVDTVSFIVDEIAKAPGFKPLGWSASKSANKWVVTLDCQDGDSRKQAQWEYDPTSKKVRYLDLLSKILSWMPAE